ncbi:hypothetical protein [Cypionkella psychrotolerans]|nr:hypothetical protein [Cypionkella psychrotolerans]
MDHSACKAPMGARAGRSVTLPDAGKLAQLLHLHKGRRMQHPC